MTDHDCRDPLAGIRRASHALLACTLLATAASSPAETPHAGMLRDPDVSATSIAFRYADDLWLVSRDGGTATPLANPAGVESRPRFSPDGQTIAFMANYDGGVDLYTLPVAGGVPFRVTHHPLEEVLDDWTPDGELLFHLPSSEGIWSRPELWSVSAGGGLPRRLPVPSGAEGAISPDGRWLAYSPNTTRYYRTWKRYVGGTASDLALFDLRDAAWRQVTTWIGTDATPMWHGATLYYLSDAGPAHRLNLWSWDPSSGISHQLTHYGDDDVRQPSIGPGPAGAGEIVFQLGDRLHLLDLENLEARTVEIHIPGALAALRPQRSEVAEQIESGSPSPSGARVAVEARGDVWSLPAEHGTPRNLTRSSGVAERTPAWSPDGRSIAYFSDRSGESQLHVIASDGSGEERQVTTGPATFFTQPVWSPDSRHVAFEEKTGELWLVTIESGERNSIARDPWARAPRRLAWSPDSRWLAVDLTSEAGADLASIWLYDVVGKELHRVTSDRQNDHDPLFDRRGDFLFFVSDRSLEPTYSDLEFAFVHADTSVLVAVPLRRDVALPYRARSDEESAAEPAGDGAKKEAEEVKSGERLAIDLDGIESRAFLLPAKPGSFSALGVSAKGQLLYLRRSGRGLAAGTSLQLLDLADEKKEEKTVTSNLDGFVLTARGEQALVRGEDGRLAFHAAEAGAEGKAVVTEGMAVWIDPRTEWHQLFTEAWRFFRDLFYDPAMHGLDWRAVGDRYRPMIDSCASRRDVDYVLDELVSELSVGHARFGRGPQEETPTVAVGMLGADYAPDPAGYRLARIVRAAPWEIELRNPLLEPGVELSEGDLLLAVNGVPLDTQRDPWAAFTGLADRDLTLTVRRGGDPPRQVVVHARDVDWEWQLRFGAWAERTRQRVDEASGGRVGYVFIPDYVGSGLNSLMRQLLPQRHKEALIIDQRWNGGGFTPDRFLEILDRPLLMMRARRDGRDTTVPTFAHFGPKCLLMNELSGSSGDMFPWMFRQAGLGKLIGTRTWGGVVGLSGTAAGTPTLIDGQRVVVPNNGTYGPDGRWIIEGWGVEPDLAVVDDPLRRLAGEDAQLEAAISEMLRQLDEAPSPLPARPAPPDRSGMGIPASER